MQGDPIDNMLDRRHRHDDQTTGQKMAVDVGHDIAQIVLANMLDNFPKGDGRKVGCTPFLSTW